MIGHHPRRELPEPDNEPPVCPRCKQQFEPEERHCPGNARCVWWMCSIDNTLYDERSDRWVRIR